DRLPGEDTAGHDVAVAVALVEDQPHLGDRVAVPFAGEYLLSVGHVVGGFVDEAPAGLVDHERTRQGSFSEHDGGCATGQGRVSGEPPGLVHGNGAGAEFLRRFDGVPGVPFGAETGVRDQRRGLVLVPGSDIVVETARRQYDTAARPYGDLTVALPQH